MSAEYAGAGAGQYLDTTRSRPSNCTPRATALRNQRSSGCGRPRAVAGHLRDINTRSKATLQATVVRVERKFVEADVASARRRLEPGIRGATAPLRRKLFKCQLVTATNRRNRPVSDSPTVRTSAIQDAPNSGLSKGKTILNSLGASSSNVWLQTRAARGAGSCSQVASHASSSTSSTTRPTIRPAARSARL
jgi:hypothetical protein